MHCTNTVGSYICGCRYGYKTVVIDDWESLKRVPSCLDIDECSNQGICPDNSICLNTPGNHTCQCHAGFQGSLCADIDECSLVGDCHVNSTCSNSDGSYKCSCNKGFYGNGKTCKKGRCDDRRCPSGQECVSPTSDECACKEGLEPDKNLDYCHDIDECILDHGCHRNATCFNSEGSFTCTCNPGFLGDGKTCDVGECKDDMCSLNEECVSLRGIDCRCITGFERDETGHCVDTDECSVNICNENADCTNSDGSFECNCRQGFFGDGIEKCLIGSCPDARCPQNQKCITATGIECECVEGFLLNDKSTCVDIDECETGTHRCDEEANCVNTAGSYTCSCKAYYSGNGFSCKLSDRCGAGFHNCHNDAICTNTYTSYSCSCDKGYTGDGFSCFDLNECSTNAHDCIFDSNCHNTIGSFTCSCQAGVGEICRGIWILVLSTSSMPQNKPVPRIIDGVGHSKEIGFSFSAKTEVHGSCSITWQNKMYVFGGITNKEQISVIDKCELTSIGELQFKMTQG